MTPLLLALGLVVPSDTLLVDLILVGSGQRVTVEAVVQPDSTLLLPARDVYAFLGLGVPTTEWTTVGALGTLYPTVRFSWVPRELRVLVEDGLGVLPVSRALRAAVERAARGGPGLTLLRGGPF